MTHRIAALNAASAPARLTRRGIVAALGALVSCRPKPPATVRPERTEITARDPGYQVLAQVANARWALGHGARVFADNELDRAISDATRLPDAVTAVFASSPTTGGRRRGQAPAAGSQQMTVFDALVRLQSAKEDVDGGDLAGADEDLAALAAAAPQAPASAELPLIQASEALKVAQGDAADGVLTRLRDELACAGQALEAYAGQARRADARALAAEIAGRLARPGGAEAVDPAQLEIWSARIATWI